MKNGSHDQAVADTFPASDPTTEQAPGGAPEPVPDATPVAVGGPGRKRVPVEGTDYALEHGAVVIAAITSCTNTSNPQVMVGAGLLAKKAVERGLSASPGSRRAWRPGSKVVTRVLRARGPDGLSRAARLPHGRLRLHDLHRKLRAAAGGDLGRGRGGRPRRLLGALGQPQLRGADPPRGEGELPRLAAARRRLRARRPDGHRPARGAARRGPGRQRRLPARHLADLRRRSRTRSRARCTATCSARPTPTSSPATSSGAACRCRRASCFAWEPDSTYVRQPPYFEGMSLRARRGRGHRRRALPRHARRLGHDRPHLARRRDQARIARRRVPASSTASSARTSTRTARAAATTR